MATMVPRWKLTSMVAIAGLFAACGAPSVPQNGIQSVRMRVGPATLLFVLPATVDAAATVPATVSIVQVLDAGGLFRAFDVLADFKAHWQVAADGSVRVSAMVVDRGEVWRQRGWTYFDSERGLLSEEQTAKGRTIRQVPRGNREWIERLTPRQGGGEANDGTCIKEWLVPLDKDTELVFTVALTDYTRHGVGTEWYRQASALQDAIFSSLVLE